MRRCLGLIAFALLFASCHQLPTERPAVVGNVRFYLESSEPGALVQTLPQSGVRIGVRAQPILTEAEVADVTIGDAELGKCLLFRLTPSARATLNRIANAAQGRRLVLAVNGVALGAKRIDGPVGGGPLPMMVEVPDVYLPRLVAMVKPFLDPTGR